MDKQERGQVADENLIVFYADDDHDDLETFKDAIEELYRNITLYTHDRGEKLLNALKNAPAPHLIFIDLNMPGKNGFQILEEIRSSNDFKNLPIVIISTSSDEQTIVKSQRLGANYYIPKPNDYFTLKKSINHALSIDWNTFKPDSKDFVYRNN